MGKLAHLNDGLSKVQAKLASADKSNDIRRGELDSLLSGRFNKVSDRLEGAINRLMKESDKAQNVSLKSAVDGVVKAVADTHGIFQQGLAQISQEVKLSHNVLTDEIDSINKEIGKVNSGVGGVNQNLAGQMDNLAKSVKRLPTQFPAQKDVDFSGITYALKSLHIPDVSPQLKSLEERLNKREFVFNVERDPGNDLIRKIVVKEK